MALCVIIPFIFNFPFRLWKKKKNHSVYIIYHTSVALRATMGSRYVVTLCSSCLFWKSIIIKFLVLFIWTLRSESIVSFDSMKFFVTSRWLWNHYGLLSAFSDPCSSFNGMSLTNQLKFNLLTKYTLNSRKHYHIAIPPDVVPHKGSCDVSSSQRGGFVSHLRVGFKLTRCSSTPFYLFVNLPTTTIHQIALT